MNRFWFLTLASIFAYAYCSDEEVKKAEDCLLLLKDRLIDPSIQTHLKKISEKQYKPYSVKRDEYLLELKPLTEKLENNAEKCMDQELFDNYAKAKNLNQDITSFNNSVKTLYFTINELHLSLENDNFDKLYQENKYNRSIKIEDNEIYKKQLSFMRAIVRLIDNSILPKEKMFPAQNVEKKHKSHFSSPILGRKKKDQDKQKKVYF